MKMAIAVLGAISAFGILCLTLYWLMTPDDEIARWRGEYPNWVIRWEQDNFPCTSHEVWIRESENDNWAWPPRPLHGANSYSTTFHTWGNFLSSSLEHLYDTGDGDCHAAVNSKIANWQFRVYTPDYSSHQDLTAMSFASSR